MKIHKILNNNFVVTLDEKGCEQIVGGKGIAFGKSVGNRIDNKLVERTFILPNENNQGRNIQTYIDALPIDFFEIAADIVDYASVKTDKNINKSACLAIADHIFTSIERQKQDMKIPNYILWEIKNFYPVEYEVGLYALDLINNVTGFQLSDDEAGFIATHIIDSELESSNITLVYKTTELIKDITSIVKECFDFEFDPNSIYYYRFITHLKFFASRLFGNISVLNCNDDRLYNIIQTTYIDSFNCTLKIEKYLNDQYEHVLSKEEKVYLTIHIENITNIRNQPLKLDSDI